MPEVLLLDARMPLAACAVESAPTIELFTLLRVPFFRLHKTNGIDVIHVNEEAVILQRKIAAGNFEVTGIDGTIKLDIAVLQKVMRLLSGLITTLSESLTLNSSTPYTFIRPSLN